MLTVPRVKDLGGGIENFSGKDYPDAIKRAEEWAARNHKELVACFYQKAFGRSILVSYKEQPDES